MADEHHDHDGELGVLHSGDTTSSPHGIADPSDDPPPYFSSEAAFWRLIRVRGRVPTVSAQDDPQPAKILAFPSPLSIRYLSSLYSRR
jgi:hypothetical protein